MSDSKVSYKIETFKQNIPQKDYSNNLNAHNYFRVTKDSALETHAFNIKGNTQYLFNQAEKLFGEKKLDQAIVYYEMTLKADSSLSNVMTYIGQIYEMKGNLKDASQWYRLAISKNYIDYMAHWFLADAYMHLGDTPKAIDEIIIARIMNRNNYRIKSSMDKILEISKRDTTDWYFTPQMDISQLQDKSVRISAAEKWFGYAMSKALWEYEPGYMESMGVAKGEYSLTELRECLASLTITLENSKANLSNDPQLRTLFEAAQNGYLDEYIWYEIVLPEKPFVAMQLPVSIVERIKDYILKYRNKTI